MDDERIETTRARRVRISVLRVALLVLIVAVAGYVAYRIGWLDYRAMLARVERLRRTRSIASFAALFVLTYGIAAALGVPGTPMTVAAGALFGTAVGTLLAWAGAMVSAAMGYWLARKIGRGVIGTLVRRHPRVDTVIAEARDFAGMVRLRLFPVLPLGLVNFVEGLARAPFVPYLAATAIGVIPSTLIFAYFADSLVAGAGNGWATAMKTVVAASLLLIAVTLAPRMLRSRP